MSDEYSYDTEEGAELVAERIRTFFANDPQYKWGGELGRGANGAVYKIIRMANGEARRIAVKIPPVDVDLGPGKSFDEADGYTPDEVLSIQREKIWLERLRNCSHIIKSLDLPNDPLSKTPPGFLPHRMQTWIFMEFAENGGLETFVERYTEQYPGKAMPNRLLWRFFMCLIRGCLEMAYYNIALDGQLVDTETDNFDVLGQIEPGALAHQDLSYHNVVVGATGIDTSPEHNMTPILKLIDFGEAGLIDPEFDMYHLTGSDTNVREISEIMACLIVQDRRELRVVQVTVQGITFETRAKPILDRHDELINAGLDVELLNLVYRGMSMQREVRPGLVELARIVHERVWNRGDNGVHKETDEAIKRMLSDLIHDGAISKRRRDDDDDDDDDEHIDKRRRLFEPEGWVPL